MIYTAVARYQTELRADLDGVEENEDTAEAFEILAEANDTMMKIRKLILKSGPV